MARTQIITLATFAALAFAGTSARADDITMAGESFMSGKSRVEVRAEVLKARADGAVFATEIDLSPTTPAMKGSAVSREQVRAEVGAAARKAIMQWYPA
jgi:hypothetical protein